MLAGLLNLIWQEILVYAKQKAGYSLIAIPRLYLSSLNFYLANATS